MNIKPLYRKIPLNRIDPADPTFLLAPAADEEVPDHSQDFVGRWAIIHPPVLRERGDARFTVVTGRRQIVAVRRLPAEDYCACLVLPVDTPGRDLLLMALQEILLSRPATPMEKAICWRKGVELLGRDRAGRELGPRLELSGQLGPERLEKLLTLDRTMQEALHKGSLDLKACLKLLDIDPPDRNPLFETMTRLRLSSSNQRKIVDCCRELEKRRGRSIAAILGEPACLEIINHSEANPPQKAAMMMNRLTALCYPNLTEAEKDFRGFVADLTLPKGAHVEHAPSFEKDSLKLSIEFADRRRLAAKWPEIKKILAAANHE
ncbi:MAG: hypothetical protein P1P81_09275 [Desulfobulbales bacterium]|nr:hypothetical protein [Desulfobulbales bacterium]